jgi:hypothetical protein
VAAAVAAAAAATARHQPCPSELLRDS